MSVENFEQLYRLLGFFWNQHIKDFVTEFGGRTVTHPHFGDKRNCVAEFCPSYLFNYHYENSMSEELTERLGERVAPLGYCQDGYLSLFLTESGALIGYCEGSRCVWGGFSSGWRESLRRLLSGEFHEEIDLGDRE